MPSQLDVDKIRHTNGTDALTFDTSGNTNLQKDLKFGSTAAIKNSAGNNILSESGGNVTLENVRLPASGGISDSSGNNVLTESGGTVTFGNVIGSVPAGAIMSFAMSSAPSGWVICNGAEYAIADYGDLHTAIGTTWGALTNGSGGAGSTHFRVPDLRGAFLRGTGTGTINARNKAGGSVGLFQEDSFQGFKSQLRAGGGDITIQNADSGGQVTGKIPYGTASGGSARTVTIDHIDNGSNGTPRVTSETKPYNASVQYCIKY